MAKAKTYQTHTGLLIYLTAERDVVGVVGDRDKEVLKTPDPKAALKCFESLVKHYEARRLAEAP